MNALSPGALEEMRSQAGMAAPAAPVADSLGAFGAVSVRLSVEVGAVKLSLREVLAMQVGAVHTLDRRVDQPVDVLINERLIARGEIVAVGDRFGVKLTEIIGGVTG